MPKSKRNKLEPNPLALKSGDKITMQELDDLEQNLNDVLPFDKRKFTHRIKDISKTVDLTPENILQAECENWLKVQKIKYIHVPQSVYKNQKTKRFFYGVPDLLIFTKFKDYNLCHLIELKSLEGHARQGQEAWAKGLNVYLLRSFEDFKREVLKFLDMAESLEKILG